jgi:glycosyltransferase involved in cell wall biosynthesis
MKIGQVIDTLEIGGAEKIAVLLANLIAENGHESTLITLVNSGKLKEELSEEVNCINLKRTSKWSFSAARKFFTLIENYDILQVHLRHNLKWILFWGSIIGIKGKIIFHDHGNTPISKNLIFSFWRKRIHQIIVNKGIYRNHTQKIFPNTYYLQNISKIFPPLGRYNSDPSSVRFVVVSNIREIKNIQFSMQILAKIALRKKISLDIYFSNSETVYMHKILQTIQDLELSDIITFIEGDTNPQKNYWKYDIGLHTSHLESGPLTILEYMGHGLPFISYDTGQSIELIRKIYPEMIASDFNLDNWIKNITLIARNGRQYYSNKLTELYTKNCSEENYYHQWEKIVKSNQL